MPQFRAVIEFTAQSKTLEALNSWYAHFNGNNLPQIELTPFVVLTAFVVEAYLNSLGSRQFPAWDDLERLPWKTKVVLLHDKAGKNPDWGAEPLQYAAELFKLRDTLAHGKPERVVGPARNSEKEAQGDIDGLQPRWYSAISLEWLVLSMDRFRELQVYLAALFGLPSYDPLHTASSGTEKYE